jgi:hypothetical protein
VQLDIQGGPVIQGQWVIPVRRELLLILVLRVIPDGPVIRDRLEQPLILEPLVILDILVILDQLVSKVFRVLLVL